MSDEFDDWIEPSHRLPGPRPVRAVLEQGVPAARLVARLYRSADDSLRARMLAFLVRPLGTLSLAVVAAGAFGRLLPRDGVGRGGVALDEVSRYSNEQILELARFAQQVNPEALQQVATLLTDNALGLAAFSASAAVLLFRRLRPMPPPEAAPALDAEVPAEAMPLASSRPR